MMRLIRRALFFIILLVALGLLIYTKVLRPIPVVGYEVVRDDLLIEVMGTGSVRFSALC